jgi:hypothetical protein
MFEKTLLAVVVTLFCAIPGFAQQNEAQKEKIEKPCTETQILDKGNADKRRIEEIEFRGISGSGNWLGKFIPDGIDAWAVKIVTTGGFSGKGQPTVKVFSDGDMIVENNGLTSGNITQLDELRQLSADVLQKISQIVNSKHITEKAKNIAETNEPMQKETSFLCNDCYQTTITIVRRDANGEIRYFTNREKNLLFSTGDFNRIRQIISESTDALN